jgi:HD-GYP domain-containing protein (c-di-GMP phosphodiesterase class II)
MSNKKDFYIKIKPTIFGILFVLTFIVVVISLFLQFYFSKELATNSMKEQFKLTSQKIDQRVTNFDESQNNLISLLEVTKGIKTIPTYEQRHPLLNELKTILENNQKLFALYIANDDKEYFEIANIDVGNKLRAKYSLDENAKWYIVKIYNKDNQRVRYEHFLDKDLNIIKTIQKDVTYDPTIRDWYKNAMKQNKIIKTEPYMFSNLDAKGISYAKRINNTNSVVALDVSLSSFSDFLNENSIREENQILIFKDDFKILESVNNDEKINDKLFSEIKKLFDSNIKNKNFLLEINSKEYLVHYSKIDSKYDSKDNIAILLPFDIVMEPYLTKIYYSLIVSILILFIIVPIAWLFSRALVNPIQKLVSENQKISDRKFDEVNIIDTKIMELKELSISLFDMSKSIKDYQIKQEELMDSFIKVIASAIDAKSKYTGGHCERVPVLAIEITKEASKSNEGIFKDFKIETNEQKREIEIASWLHDSGKVTTPEYVVDKATKLETIYNRIHEIRTRFEVIHRDLTIQMYENILNGANKESEELKLKEAHEKLFEEFNIIATANVGGEFMREEDILKVEEIAKRKWKKYFNDKLGLSIDELSRVEEKEENYPKEENLLMDKNEHIIERDNFSMEDYNNHGFKLEVPKYLYNRGEIYNLSIQKGTLTNEERFKINEHMIMTIKMLEALPFPDTLKNVVEIAGSHHETLIGTGYPKKLKKEDMSIPARILAVADIFEALTAADRPYKEAKTLSQSIKILSFMVKDKHIDEDIFKLFLKSGVYKKYASKYLKKEQIDDVKIEEYL